MSTTAARVPMRYAPPAPRESHDVRDAIAAGQRFEYGGVPARALALYRTAVALADTPVLRAEAVRRVGDAHRALGAWADAREAYDESLTIARTYGDADLEAEALNALATIAILHGNADDAVPLFARALACAPGPRVRGLVLTNLGLCDARAGEHAQATELFVASLDCYRDAGYARGELMALSNLAAVYIETGDAAAALPLLREAAAIARRLGELDLLVLTVQNKAEACLKLGRLDEAERCIGEALGHFSSAGSEARRAECLTILGDVLRAHRTAEQDLAARRCYERAIEIAESAGAAHVADRACKRRDQM